jgi:sulfate adenylyltransferase subunit 2
MNYNIDFLDELESEAIFIIREVASNPGKAAIMFSGGKDSLVLIHLARKAFYPASIPFIMLHVDTGFNFPEVEEFRDKLCEKYSLKLLVASVEKAIENGELQDDPEKDRNRLQIPVLLDCIKRERIDIAIGGGRRDEEKSRAKERIFSHRDINGQWHPENQRPELWSIFNSNKMDGEHFRVFPLSNWTEIDIWHYIHREKIELPSVYFSHRRKIIKRKGMLIAYSELMHQADEKDTSEMTVRCRTVGDMISTGLWESSADTVEKIIEEISTSAIGERGARADDMVSPTSMEDRKRKGYF